MGVGGLFRDAVESHRDEHRNKERSNGRWGCIRKEGVLKNGKRVTVGRGEMKAEQETEIWEKRISGGGGGETGTWVSYRERSCTALMKKEVQLDGEPSVSASPGGFIITLHS